jgi:hypothetical protein
MGVATTALQPRLSILRTRKDWRRRWPDDRDVLQVRVALELFHELVTGHARQETSVTMRSGTVLRMKRLDLAVSCLWGLI